MSVDLGRLTIAAQRCQDVVDGAALAAARSLPDTSAAQTAANSLIMSNNVEQPAFAVSSDSEDIATYGPGEFVGGYGTLQTGEAAVEVTGHLDVDFSFAPMLGVEGSTVTRSATALQTREGEGSTCIWANAQIDNALIFPLDTIEVTGYVHSNGSIQVSGNNLIFHDVVEYNRSLYDSADNTTYEKGHTTCEVEPYPIDYTAEDFAPFDHEIFGNWVPATNELHLSPGVYRVYGYVDIRSDVFTAYDCTIIADGDIHIAGEAPIMSPHMHDVALYSLYGDIDTTADGTQVDGIVFAPNGHVDYLGDGQRVASLIAETVSLHGDTADVTAVPGIGTMETNLRLLK